MNKYGYMYLINSTNRQIKGPVNIVGREDSIEVLYYSHQISVPGDLVTGKLTDYPQHSAFKIRKRIDKSSVSLKKCLTTKETISTCIITWYEVREDGIAVESYSVSFKNLKIIEFTQQSEHSSTDDTIYEELKFTYGSFTWKNFKGNISYTIALELPPEQYAETQHIKLEPQYAPLLTSKKIEVIDSLLKKPYHGNVQDFYYHSTRATNMSSIVKNGLMPTTIEIAVGGTTMGNDYLFSSLKVMATKFYSILFNREMIDLKSPLVIKQECSETYPIERDKFFSDILATYKEITSFNSFDEFFQAKTNKSAYEFPGDYPEFLGIDFDWEKIAPTNFYNHYIKKENINIKRSLPSKSQSNFLMDEIRKNKVVHDIIISYSIYKGMYETTKNNVGTLCLAEEPGILSTYISKPLSEGIGSCIFRIPKKS